MWSLEPQLSPLTRNTKSKKRVAGAVRFYSFSPLPPAVECITECLGVERILVLPGLGLVSPAGEDVVR